MILNIFIFTSDGDERSPDHKTNLTFTRFSQSSER